MAPTQQDRGTGGPEDLHQHPCASCLCWTGHSLWGPSFNIQLVGRSTSVFDSFLVLGTCSSQLTLVSENTRAIKYWGGDPIRHLHSSYWGDKYWGTKAGGLRMEGYLCRVVWISPFRTA